MTPADPDPTATTVSDPPPDALPAFEPVTYEAEAGTTIGSAWAWGYPSASGGQIVRNIGNWGNCCGTAGTLQINDVSIPSTGPYTITVYFVHINNDSTRSATVTVSDYPEMTEMTVTFTGGSTCCYSMELSNINMSEGTHTITFANPTGHAPSIDRIVISRS